MFVIAFRVPSRARTMTFCFSDHFVQPVQPLRGHSNRGMTIVQAVIAVVLIGVALGAFVLFLNFNKIKGARHAQSMTKLRGIHQSMFTYAQSNAEYFPGVTSKGKVADKGEAGTVFDPSLNGASVEHRFAVMLDSDYFDGRHAISPYETKTVWANGPVTQSNYSYAMLRFHSDATSTGETLGSVRPDQGGRAKAWHGTLDGQVAVLGDRSMQNAGGSLYSIRTSDPGASAADDWRGAVGWADNAVIFESTHEIDTKYGSALGIVNDHLFRTDQGNATFAVPGEGPWDEVMDSANAVLDAVGSSAGVEATRMTGE